MAEVHPYRFILTAGNRSENSSTATQRPEMPESTSLSSRDNAMGQTSSQELSQSPEKASAMAIPEKSREDSRNLRSRQKILESEQALDQEQESARALIQLAQGGLGKVDDTVVRQQATRKQVPRRYMTSQERIDNEVEIREQDRRLKRQKKRQKKSEISNVLADLDADGTQPLDADQQSKAPMQSDRSVADQREHNRHGASHPLDNVSTDEEVEEYTKGTQDINGVDGASAWGLEPSQTDALSGEMQQEEPSLPTYSTSQRMKAGSEMLQDQPRPRKKRKRATETSSDLLKAELQGNGSLDTHLHARKEDTTYTSNHRQPHDSYPQTQGHEPDADAAVQNLDMPIDPSLDDWSREAPGPVQSSPKDTHNYEQRSKATVKKRTPKRGSIKRSPEYETNPSAFEEETSYISPYTSFERPEDSSNPAESREQAKFGSKQLAAPIPRMFGSKNHFGQTEIERIERFRDSWCEVNEKKRHHFNEVVQSTIRGNPTAVGLFKDLQDMFPFHPPSYIQRFCRRKFHNFSARGTWTHQEDDKLRDAVADKGTSWKAIGEELQRFPEDCRDRWRNYIVNMEHRNHEQWTDAEVLNVARAILDCVQSSKTEHFLEESKDVNASELPFGADVDPEDVDMKLVNWQAVSDRMGKHGGTRSRLQCSFKWNKLKAADQMQFLREAHTSRLQGTNIYDHPSQTQTKAAGWRMAQSRKKVSNMLPGDKVDLLQAILDTVANSEGNIPWKSVGSDSFQAKWSTTERKAAWLMMKDSLGLAESEDYRQTIYRLLQAIPETQRDERWDSSQYDSLHPSQQKRPYTRPKSKRNKGKAVDTPINLQPLNPNADFLFGNNSNNPETANDSGLDGDGEYRPPADLTNSAEGFAGLDPLLTNEPKPRHQRAAPDSGTYQNGTNGVNGHHDPSFEPQMQAGMSTANGGLDFDLADRILGLQNA